MFTDKSVLTIDDSDTIRSYLKSVLAPLGAQVDGAATGQEGLVTCAGTQYDLILLDLILPDTDGIEVLQHIRAQNTTSTIVMLTGHGGIRSAIAAVQLGADGYLQKQEMTATSRDHSEFLYAIEQAFDHRAGLIAQQQLEAMRADFYSMVTHDLRNPASTVQVALEMLIDGTAGELAEGQRDLVQIASHSTAKMLRLIHDYLDYAKIDAGYLRLDRRVVDLRRVIEDSAQLFILQAHSRQQSLTLDMPSESVMAYADSERLMQVLDNLLSNACKYTPEGGRIVVQLRTDDDRAVFCISDTGVGIAPEHLPALFTKYHRIPGETVRGIQGTGLGLLIVKEIVGAHGGIINAESEGVPGRGTVFTFSIPMNQEVETVNVPRPAAQSFSHFVLDTEMPSDDSDNDELYRTFMQESQKHIHMLHDLLDQMYDTPADHHLLEAAQRATHTLKGNAGAMQFNAVYDLAAQMDTVLQQAVKGNLMLTLTHITNLTKLLGQLDMVLTIE